MQIGVRITGESVSAVAVGPDVSLHSAEMLFEDDLGAAVTAVVSELGAALRSPVTSVVFDVSEALVLDGDTSITSVLIEPRHPLEMRKHLWLAEDIPVRTAHLRGGHAALGHELVALEEMELQALVEQIASGEHFVISAAGSSGNPDHEHRVAAALRAAAPTASVLESAWFSSESLLIREFTAVVNTLLLKSAEMLTTILADASARGTSGDVRAFVMTNDGGCTPLTRLSITPVHSLRSRFAATMLGAATLARHRDGWFAVAAEGVVRAGEFIDGLPSLINRTPLPGGASLASSAAHIVPLTDLLVSGSVDPTVVVLAPGTEKELAALGLAPKVVSGADLVAIGAAVAPMSYWYQRVVPVQTATDIEHALRAGEGSARANLVAAGADPGGVHVAESRVLATAYGEAHVVRLRIRAVAETPSIGVRPAGAVIGQGA